VILLSKGKNKINQNCTKQNKTKTQKVSQVQMQYSFSKFFSMQVCLVVVSSKVGREKRKKKKRVWRLFCEWLSVAIWGCGLPARCCQPAVAGGFIYADLRCELNTHLAPQALFTQSSPVHDSHCYKLSPFLAHWGR
jgi:hypothetical protein